MARYLIRFDDICPTMRWDIFSRAEQVLLSHGVRPILSVIPDNRDERLHFDPPHPGFWERVRQWQSWGWTIALHGYQHRYTSNAPGIVGIKHASEFAGVSLREQLSRLRQAAAIFRAEGVDPRVWVAPGHSFDSTTITLLGEVGISCISDGLFLTPRFDETGMLWIPQQLWRFRRLPFGVWTVCFHHNRWTEAQIQEFGAGVAGFRSLIVGFDEIERAFRSARRAPVDGVVPRMFRYYVGRRQRSARAAAAAEFI